VRAVGEFRGLILTTMCIHANYFSRTSQPHRLYLCDMHRKGSKLKRLSTTVLKTVLMQRCIPCQVQTTVPSAVTELVKECGSVYHRRLADEKDNCVVLCVFHPEIRENYRQSFIYQKVKCFTEFKEPSEVKD